MDELGYCIACGDELDIMDLPFNTYIDEDTPSAYVCVPCAPEYFGAF